MSLACLLRSRSQRFLPGMPTKALGGRPLVHAVAAACALPCTEGKLLAWIVSKASMAGRSLESMEDCCAALKRTGTMVTLEDVCG